MYGIRPATQYSYCMHSCGETNCTWTLLNSRHFHVHSVLIVVAMEAEAAPFVEHLNLEQNDDFFPPQVPFLAFSGNHEGCSLTVVTNGKDELYGTGVDNCGTVPASLVTFLSLQKDASIDLVVNAGTCGG